MNRQMTWLLVSAVLLGWFGWGVVLPRVTGTQAPLPLMEMDPEQVPLAVPERVTVRRGDRDFIIEKTHHYVIEGEVLSATSYDLVWTNDFFDVDVGLLWGTEREHFKQRYTFSQSGRWLFWRSPTPVSEAWEKAVSMADLPINTGVRVEAIDGDEATSWCAPRPASSTRGGWCSPLGAWARRASWACPVTTSPR
jgi:hypothetical protein